MHTPPGYRPVTEPAPIYTPSVSGCKVEGCSCRDARILSTRKLAFFKALAEQRGQTVGRVITAQPLVGLLVREDESEPIKSERPDNACRCADCGAECDGLLTIASTARCRDCSFGQHAAAKA